MKRITLLALVAVMCLSLCACGQNKTYEKYQTIIDNLENGHYQNAIDLIENMAQADSAGSNTESTSKEPALTPEQIAWQTKAVGTWLPDKSAMEDGHTGFVIKDDGTCTVDDKNYTWTIGNAAENSARLDVRDGQAMAYELHLSVHTDYGYKQASMNIYLSENSLQGTSYRFFRQEDYTVVQVNTENWQEYFEIEELLSTEVDAFGDVNDFCGHIYLRLKDTCGNINVSLSSGGVEYQGVSTCQDITVDLASMTYVPVGDVHNTSDYHESEKMAKYIDSHKETYYGVSMGSFCAYDVDENPTDTVWRPMNIEILRLEATLYIVK